MNGKNFSSWEQKGIKQESGYVKTQPFYAEGNGTKKDVRYSPKVREIKTLADYFALLKEIHEHNEKRLKVEEKECGSLFLYRGQANVEWNYSPSGLRDEKNLKREYLIQREFHRTYFEKMDSMKTVFDEEVLMQHYGAGSRVLDLLESPLMALWAACGGDRPKDNSDKYGEVSFWCLDYENDDLKAYDSSTVSLIANTAKCDYQFYLGNLEIEYHKEHPTSLQDFICLKDVLRRTVVARPKYNNVRFTHQLNCFAVMNLNKLVDKDGAFSKKFGITVEQFSDYILNAAIINKDKNSDYQKPNISRLRRGLHTLGKDFSELESWDLTFEKCVPNDSSFVDTFDLYKYMYNDSDNKNEKVPIYAVIPPEAKMSLLKELKYANVTTATVYPDMNIVASELLKSFALKID